MNDKPRILFVVNVAWFFVSHRLPIALAAKEAGYDVHVACARDSEVIAIEQAGLTYHPLPMSRSGTGVVAESRTIFSLLRLYKDLRPDLIHHVTIKPVIYGSILARVTGVPAVVNAIPGLGYIFTGQGLRIRFFRSLISSAYRFALGHNCSKVIFQNPDDCNLFVSHKLVDKSKTVLIFGSGVDLDKFVPRPEPKGVPAVILASRLLWDKGVGEFVEAAKNLQNRGVKAHFILVGDSDSHNPKAVSVKQLKDWQNAGFIEWWGHKSDMEKIFSRANLVCLPSYYREGMPKVLLEAAACGRAVITTDTPGCRNTIIDGETGFLVQKQDALALADAMEKLISSEKLRHQFGLRARILAEKSFSVDTVVEKTLHIYRYLLGSL